MNTLFATLAEPTARVAITVAGESLQWDELASACVAHRNMLVDAGVEPGDRVAVWAKPTLGTAAAIVGNLAYGVVTVPLNPKLGTRERDHILGTAMPSLIIDEPELEFGEETEFFIEVDDRPALIIFTSGTTGSPKGAVLTVRNIAACLDGLIDAWLWNESDVVVHSLPMFHVHGLVLGLLGSLRAGGAMVLLPRFEIGELKSALAAGTMLFGVPTMYHRLAEAIGTDPELGEVLRRARMTISGSAGLAARDARILRQHDIEVHQRYGLTETLINCAARFGEPIVDGTVGPALEGIELRIVSETRETLGPAEIGEVAVRGDNVFPGYLDDLEATAAVKDDDGWFYTGDVAEIDESGNVRIHGRKSTDLIKSGGYKIGAGEVEACLLEREEVKEVAVVGMPDDDLGERVVAFVVARNDAPIHEQSLIDHVARQLSPHKRPRQINVVAGLPRNAMGKVQKKRLLDG